MTRIEKLVIVVLGSLALAFLGQIIGSTPKLQATAPVAAQEAPAVTKSDLAQSDRQRVAEQLRAKANAIRDEMFRGCRRYYQSSDAIDGCESEFSKVWSDLIGVIGEAERAGRDDLLKLLSQKMAQQKEESDYKKRYLALCQKYIDLGLSASQCLRDYRDMNRP